MKHTSTTLTVAKPTALPIVWAGLIAGTLDITAALVVYGYFGAKPIPLLQGIAGGLLGPRTFEGGLATALLGLLCHFFIAFSVAAIYFVMSRGWRFLNQHAVVSGICTASPFTSS